MIFILVTIWHYLYMATYRIVSVVGWVLEMLFMFVAFVLAGVLAHGGKLW